MLIEWEMAQQLQVMAGSEGRGYIQLTGKDNYVAFSKDTGIDVVSNPDIIQRDPLLCLLTAFWYWDKKQPESVC